MNKSELIEHIAKQADISKAAASRSLEAVIGAVKTTLKKGGNVTITGFGTFTAPKRAALHRPQPAHRRRDQDQGGQGTQVPPRQGPARRALSACTPGA